MESHNSIAENNQEPAEDDADRARERRHLEQAIRTASRISEITTEDWTASHAAKKMDRQSQSNQD